MKEKMGGTPFDHRPDPLVGEALRRMLTTGDDGGFAARVLAAAAAAPVARSPFDILAGWARPGIAAAIVAAILGGWAVGRTLIAPGETLDDAIVTALVPSPVTAALASNEGPPDGSVAFATVVEP